MKKSKVNLSAEIAKTLQSELEFLHKVIEVQGKLYAKSEASDFETSIFDLDFPQANPNTPFGRVLKDITQGQPPQTAFAIRFVICLALAPQIQPQALDLLGAPDEKGLQFTEYGRFRDENYQGFLPTVQTALFILAGNDLNKRFAFQALFRAGSPLIDQDILKMRSQPGQSELLRNGISISDEYLSLFTSGQAWLPQFSSDFPASRISTGMNWEDLVLNPFTLNGVEELKHWLKYREKLAADPVLSKRIKPGFRVLFHGPPGTGKTLTASLLGKSTGLPVYRIDLSAIISKYIGETEKNLSRLFDRAKNKNWILFFDEADALFGKRTSTQSSNDRYANQELAYLLQRIEDYPGLVILASNFKANIDPAFMRRFQSVVHFPQPKFEQRLTLWQNSFPESLPADQDFDLDKIAAKYELTGANIVNVLHSAGLQALRTGLDNLNMDLVLDAIRKELRKEERVVD